MSENKEEKKKDSQVEQLCPVAGTYTFVNTGSTTLRAGQRVGFVLPTAQYETVDLLDDLIPDEQQPRQQGTNDQQDSDDETVHE